MIWLQTPTVFWLGRGAISLTLNTHVDNGVRKTDIHTTEPLVYEPSTFGVELAIEKLKSHKSPGTDQIPAEFIKTGGRRVHYEIH